MKSVYLDHNIYSKIYDKKTSYDFENLQQKLKQSNTKLVISLTNISEIAKIKIEDKKNSILSFINNCNYDLLPFPHNIQMAEFKNFLYKKYFKSNNTSEIILCSTIPQVLNHFIPGADIRLNMNFTDVINLFTRNKELSNKLEENWIKYTEINQLYYKNINNKIISKEQQREFFDVILKRRVECLIPERDPDNNFIEINKRINIRAFLIENIVSCYENCPSFYVEEKLFEQRYKNLTRNFELQDYRDIAHAVSALGYCDYFVTNDKNLSNDLKFINNISEQKLAKVIKDITL